MAVAQTTVYGLHNCNAMTKQESQYDSMQMLPCSTNKFHYTLWYGKVQCPTQHIIGHFRDDLPANHLTGAKRGFNPCTADPFKALHFAILV